mmetsp:Transcript_3689/g.5912  ORF Transcript_3689/g.5912 Transcript_3689/m.5912 type:complete len:233 (+) Transcript_3689:48-746(+)
MLDALRQRGASLVKLGSWPLFYARWQGKGSERMLSGSFWLFNTTATFAQLGWGFSYFFSRSCEAAGVRGITHDSTHDWDQKWVEAIVATGLHAAVVETHPQWLVIKVHQSDSISRPNPELLSPLRASTGETENGMRRLRETLHITKLPRANCTQHLAVDTRPGTFDLDLIPAADADECCALCSRHEGCRSFLLLPAAQEQGLAVNLCYLKSSAVVETISCPRCVFGRVHRHR